MCVTSTGDKSLASAQDLLLPPDHSYESWQELVERSAPSRRNDSTRAGRLARDVAEHGTVFGVT